MLLKEFLSVRRVTLFQSYAKTPAEERAHLGRALLIGGGLAAGGIGIGAGLRAGMMSGAVRTSEKLRGVIRGMRQAKAAAAAKSAAGMAAGVDAAISGDAMRRASQAAKDARAAKKAGREFFKARAPHMTPKERAAMRGKAGFVFREPPKSGITGEVPIPDNKPPRTVRRKTVEGRGSGVGRKTVESRGSGVEAGAPAAVPASAAPAAADGESPRLKLIRAAYRRSKGLSFRGPVKFFAEQTVVKQKRDGLSKARDVAQLAGGIGVLGLAGYGGFRVHGLYKQAAKHIPGIAAEVKKAVPKVAKVAEDTMGATRAAAENVTKQADNIGHSTAIYSDAGRIYKAVKRGVAGGVYNIIHPRQTAAEMRNAFRAGLRGEKDYIKGVRPKWALKRSMKAEGRRLKFFAAEPLSWKRKAGVAAGLGVAAGGAALMPAAVSMMKIPGRRIFGSARQAAVQAARRLPGLRGIKSPVADVHAGGRMVADYLDASQAAMNRGLQGKLAGAILHHAKKNPKGWVAGKIGGDFKVDHYARFRSGHKQALGHWDWEVGELYKERAKGVVNPKTGKMKKAMSPGRLKAEQDAMHQGREAAHAEINTRMYDHGDSEAEAIRHVATNTQSAHVRGYFDKLAATKAKVAEGYARQALVAPGAIAAGSAGAVASAKAGRKKKEMSRKEFIVRSEDGIPYSGKVVKDRYIKKIHDEDLNRRDANVLRAGVTGAAAGLLLRGGFPNRGANAAIGGGIGALGVLGIRQATKGRRDPYGERSRAAKRAERLPWIAGAATAGYLGGKRLRLFHRTDGTYFEEKRKMPAAVKAGISAAASGAALGLIPAFRRGTGLGTVLKSVAGGAAAGAAIGGGGTYVGSRILGEPRPEESVPITKRAAVGGALIGTAAGLTAGVLAHKTRVGKQVLRGWSKTWRPALWARKSGVAGASAIGAAAGGSVGGMHAADEGQQVDTINAMKKTKLFQVAPAGVKPAGEWRRENQPRDRRNFFRTVGGVAAAGGIGYMAYRAGKAHVAGEAWRKVNAANAEARAARDAARRAERSSSSRSAGSSARSGAGFGGGVDWEDFFNDFRSRYGTAGGNGTYGRNGTNGGYSPPPRSNARGTGADRNPHFGTPKEDKWDKWRSMRRMAEESAHAGERDSATKAADAWKAKHNLKRKLESVKRFDVVAADMGWDVRDPRGKSARVFAPGSRRRERREAKWHEKKDAQRNLLIGAGLLAAGVVGAGGFYGGKMWGRGQERIAQLRRVKAAAVRPAANVTHVDFKTAS